MKKSGLKPLFFNAVLAGGRYFLPGGEISGGEIFAAKQILLTAFPQFFSPLSAVPSSLHMNNFPERKHLAAAVFLSADNIL